MEQKLNNILFINTGGGIGDALSVLPTINYINEQLQPKNFYYFSTDLGNFWFLMPTQQKFGGPSKIGINDLLKIENMPK